MREKERKLRQRNESEKHYNHLEIQVEEAGLEMAALLMGVGQIDVKKG